MSKAAIYARTPAQQQQLRERFQKHLATYTRPQKDGSGYGSGARNISHFRREYEHMPLQEFWHCLRAADTGHYYVLHQSGPKRTNQTPTLLSRDVLAAAHIWRQERDRWVEQWLAEAQQMYKLETLPAAFPVDDAHFTPETYGDVVPGVPKNWLLATHEWPAIEWSRETPGVFEVYEDDLDELRRLPHNLDGVGSCEPEEFEVMDERKLPDLAALSRVILALYDSYGADSLLTQSREVEKEEWQEEEDGLDISPAVSNFYTMIAFDCRSWLKANTEQDGGVANG